MQGSTHSCNPACTTCCMQVFPPRAAGSRPPVLLQTLEAQLLEAANLASRAASAGPHQQRDPQLAANLSLDAHRQVSWQSSLCFFCLHEAAWYRMTRTSGW